MPVIAALAAQARFFFLLVPRLVTGRCTPSRLAGYAFELTSSGSRCLGAWCWNRALHDRTHDGAMYEAVLNLCMRAGQYDAAEEFASGFYDASGLGPEAGIKLVGNLVLSGAYGSALNVYDRLLQDCGDDVVDRTPAPAWGRPFEGRDLRELLTSRVTSTVADAKAADDLALGFARLCFSFGAFDTSAKLFEKSRARSTLDIRDRIAEAYALLRSDRLDRMPLGIDSHSTLLDPDWHILRASVLFACGDAPGTVAAVDDALRNRFHAHADLDRMIADCNDIVTALAGSPAIIDFSPGSAADSVWDCESGLRKIFVCGNGWTGSGALYDALTEYDHFAEMPEAPGDRFLNDSTGNEMMFVQGPGGLGRIWRTARQEQMLRRSDLWELFRCQVVGAGAIGYVEHKGGMAASHLMALAGSRYTGIFRSMFEALAELPDEVDLSMLQRILNAAAESLTAVFAGDRDCVVFNNAVFGRNLDMLAIFHNFRAAVVVRDPLDTYADRRAQDVKHWMTPAHFVPFYRSSRQAFQRRRNELAPNQADVVREVEFEQFVLDETYRQTVVDWLLEGQPANRIRRRFEPARSAKNVGLHTRLLSSDERTAIEKELGQWRRS